MNAYYFNVSEGHFSQIWSENAHYKTSRFLWGESGRCRFLRVSGKFNLRRCRSRQNVSPRAARTTYDLEVVEHLHNHLYWCSAAISPTRAPVRFAISHQDFLSPKAAFQLFFFCLTRIAKCFRLCSTFYRTSPLTKTLIRCPLPTWPSVLLPVSFKSQQDKPSSSSAPHWLDVIRLM